MLKFAFYFVVLRIIYEQLTKSNKMPETKIDQFNVIKKYLPNNYLKLIREKTGTDISDRLIQYILNGERNDNHNVLDAAIDIALDEKYRLAAIQKRLKKLTK